MLTNHQINFYGRSNFEKYFFDGFASASLNQYSSSRAIKAVNAQATAKYFGQTYALKIKSGFVEKLSHGFSFVPEASLNLLHNKIGGYSEKGADTLNLRVAGVVANFLESRLGANLGWKTKELAEFPELKDLSATGRISYGYALINNAPATLANFSGRSSGFNSQISQIDRGSLKIGVAIEACHIEETTISLDYDFEHKATSKSHLVALKIRQEF